MPLPSWPWLRASKLRVATKHWRHRRFTHPTPHATLVPGGQNPVKPWARFLLMAALLVLAGAPLFAAERGVLVRSAVIYLSPDAASSKLGEAERGREVVLLDKSHNWLHVEALLGFANVADPEFVEDEDMEGKTITGWVVDTGVVWSSTANG